MTTNLNQTSAALREALSLSETILNNIELSEIPLVNIALKASRLARLIGDFDHVNLFIYEAGGYPSKPDGIPPDVWTIAGLANRIYQAKDKDGATKNYASTQSIEEIEANIHRAKLGIDAARDPNVSLASSNPNQFVGAMGNVLERRELHSQLANYIKQLGERRAFIHTYVTKKYLELKFSGIASDAFSRIREKADKLIGDTIPSAVNKLISIYNNLDSENPEDWSNAAHGCRRLLQDLADTLFPPTDKPREKTIYGKQTSIKLGPDNYINRLVCYAEDQSGSARSSAVIGSQLQYLGDRLDALFKAAQKGSHAVISSRDEADRYVVYTYMIVGDLLVLSSPQQEAK